MRVRSHLCAPLWVFALGIHQAGFSVSCETPFPPAGWRRGIVPLKRTTSVTLGNPRRGLGDAQTMRKSWTSTSKIHFCLPFLCSSLIIWLNSKVCVFIYTPFLLFWHALQRLPDPPKEKKRAAEIGHLSAVWLRPLSRSRWHLNLFFFLCQSNCSGPSLFLFLSAISLCWASCD